jgi:predicted nucleic acid-binding protein
MKILFDTSVLVAALVQPHPLHDRALSWLKKAKAEEFDLIVSSHTIAELYAVLSTLPVSPRITPGLAWRLIHESVEPVASVISLSSSDYFATIKRVHATNS